MKDNLNYTEYNEEKNRIPWGRVILSFGIIVLVVIIVFFLLRACGKTDLRNELIEAAKDYYEINFKNLPTEVGECYQLSLSTLEEANLIATSNYETCNKKKTYVNVCYLETKIYHYSAILECGIQTTNYDLWKDGTEANLTENSDVRFKFLGEQRKTGIKYYYPSDLTDTSDVMEYYATSPSTEYVGEEDEQEGYKWYVLKTVNEYWNEGEYSSTQPSGYLKKGNSIEVTNLSDIRPSDVSYRTIDEVTLYRYQQKAYPTGLIVCKNENGYIASKNPCENVEDFVKMEYTCGGSDNEDIDINTVCKEFTDWTTTKCESSVTTGIDCESKQAYSYTDIKWQWYKEDTVKSYYPSGSSYANEETTYYLTSPTADAIKDETTKATVYKFYKLKQAEQGINYEEWLPVTDGYVTYEELIKTFNDLDYAVTGLKDINSIDKIRYQYRLQYRNIEE